MIKRNIPNLLTACNLIAGCVGIILILSDAPIIFGLYAIIIAAIFDFLDGFVARLLRVASPIGKELDSFADAVTFGVLPGIMVYSLLSPNHFWEHLPWLALHIPVFSAFRLAKFNIDTRQSEHFLGLPTPANALLIASITYLSTIENSILGVAIFTPESILCITIFTSLLLVSESPLLALKFKGFSWKGNEYKFSLVIISLALLFILNIQAVPLIFILYLTFSKLHFSFNK